MHQVCFTPTLGGWLAAATAQLGATNPPWKILWTEATSDQQRIPGLFDETGLDIPIELEPSAGTHHIFRKIPRRFLTLAEAVACHRDGRKWALLYSVLWRLTFSQPRLLDIEVDDEVRLLLRMQRQVYRDTYHMKAFVRFRRVADTAEEHYVAWHQPDHDVLPLATSFFVERFATMRWSILTPDRSAHWDGKALRFSPGVVQRDAPTDDTIDDVWRTYYATTFNPARINPVAMHAQLPRRFWKSLPESRLITPLRHGVRASVERVVNSRQRTAVIPLTAELFDLEQAAARCTGCDLHLAATQTIFGRGPAHARVVLVGEQPGDHEDLAGEPFVGPAGEVLNHALTEAGLNRTELYVTNAVKHFRFVLEGRHRRHQAPRPSEIVACRPWLEAELKAVQPEIVVCLGRTAAQSLIGGQISVVHRHGRFFSSPFAPRILLTFPPSSILRARDRASHDRLFTLLVDDLRKVST
jgi:uracil-DNA glycosylase